MQYHLISQLQLHLTSNQQLRAQLQMMGFTQARLQVQLQLQYINHPQLQPQAHMEILDLARLQVQLQMMVKSSHNCNCQRKWWS